MSGFVKHRFFCFDCNWSRTEVSDCLSDHIERGLDMLCVASMHHLETSKHVKWKRCEVRALEEDLLKRTRWSGETSLNQTRANDKGSLPAAGWRQCMHFSNGWINQILIARELLLYIIMTFCSPVSFYGIIVNMDTSGSHSCMIQTL